MYIVSQAMKPVSAEELNHFEEQHNISLPSSYRRWLEQYGEGTYTGWMNIQRPDQDVLAPFVEYDFWIHTEETPISQRQLQECVSIGSSVDGDFLAVHPQVEGLLWLPRHDEHITLWACEGDGAEISELLDRIYCGYYQQDKPLTPHYFEPWNELRHHTFYHLEDGEQGKSLLELAQCCKKEFKWDAVVENEHRCILFMASIGGYLRFNYAYGREVAMFYEETGESEGRDHDLHLFLIAHHCRPIHIGGVEE
ncbi:SMI1/KNR4 family protein [Paenibacillus tundrae]|uniref:SMI1/KNR4 family protein n=1 Tax=Paenibacillus tundrae TaxID=528187 RepID=UPI0030D5D5E5